MAATVSIGLGNMLSSNNACDIALLDKNRMSS